MSVTSIFHNKGVSTDGPCVEECVLASGKSEVECVALCNGTYSFFKLISFKRYCEIRKTQ